MTHRLTIGRRHIRGECGGPNECGVCEAQGRRPYRHEPSHKSEVNSYYYRLFLEMIARQVEEDG